MDINVTSVLDKYFTILEQQGSFPLKSTLEIIVMLYVNTLVSDSKYEQESIETKTKVNELINCLKTHCLV